MCAHSRVARAPRTIATILYLLVHAACTDVTGGAVELSWRLRPASGTSTTQPFIDCTSGLPGTGPVTGVLLTWNVEGMRGSVTFDCNAGHGAGAGQAARAVDERLCGGSARCRAQAPRKLDRASRDIRTAGVNEQIQRRGDRAWRACNATTHPHLTLPRGACYR